MDHDDSRMDQMLSAGAYSAWFVRLLMLVCGVIAFPISKILDWVLGSEHEVSSPCCDSARSQSSLEAPKHVRSRAHCMARERFTSGRAGRRPCFAGLSSRRWCQSTAWRRGGAARCPPTKSPSSVGPWT